MKIMRLLVNGVFLEIKKIEWIFVRMCHWAFLFIEYLQFLS